MTTDERQLVHQRFLRDPEAKVIARAAGCWRGANLDGGKSRLPFG